MDTAMEAARVFLQSQGHTILFVDKDATYVNIISSDNRNNGDFHVIKVRTAEDSFPKSPSKSQRRLYENAYIEWAKNNIDNTVLAGLEKVIFGCIAVVRFGDKCLVRHHTNMFDEEG